MEMEAKIPKLELVDQYLPDEVIRNIFSRLPLKKVIQASLLSSNWKYHWTFHPNLEFHFSPLIKTTEIVPLINRSIAAYQGTHLRNFLLDAFPKEDISKEIEKWIDFAVGKHVSVLDLNVLMAPHFEDPCFYFEAPLSLFSCGCSIETLKLNNCIFSPPMGFEGFASLKTLCLRNTRISEETVAQVLSKSPLLETLLLHEPEGIRFLKICVPTPRLSHIVVRGDHIKGVEISAPGLQILDFTGNPETLVVSAPRLVKAIFPTLLSVRGSGDRTARVLLRDWASTIAQFSNVLALTVNMHFLMLLYADCYMNGSNPHIKFGYLKYLHVVGDLDETYGVSALVNLFRNCPGLTRVMIEPQPHHNSGSWVCEYMRTEQVRPIIVTDEEEVVKKLGGGVVGSAAAAVDFSDFDDLVHLELIIMRRFSGNAREMMFAKFLLQKAAVLDVLVLEWQPPCYGCYNPAVIKELSALAAKSSEAKIKERLYITS